MQNSQTMRLPWIDVLRGIALMCMIPANLAPLWGEPHPLWFRVLLSYAAPIFIMLSTGMVILTAKHYDFKYYLQRALLIFGFAVFMDVCIWKIFPFVTYDVLYLIGIALPIIYLLRHWNTAKLITLASLIFILTPFLQHHLGYHPEISEISWPDRYWPGTLRLLQAWLIDGWFPLFPWLGVSIFGAVFFRTVFANQNAVISKKIIFLSSLLVLVGFCLLFMPTNQFNNLANHGIIAEREGFSEIFYPPTLAYLMTAIGMVILFARLAQALVPFSVSKILALFGRFSLFIYLLHQAISVYVITPILQSYGLETIPTASLFAISVLLTILTCYLLCLLIERLKQVYSVSSLVLQMVIGK